MCSIVPLTVAIWAPDLRTPVLPLHVPSVDGTVLSFYVSRLATGMGSRNIWLSLGGFYLLFFEVYTHNHARQCQVIVRWTMESDDLPAVSCAGRCEDEKSKGPFHSGELPGLVVFKH